MIRKSRRSPIKKLSHAATGLASAASGLVDTASHAVVQGAQLSSAVVAKASTKAEHARRSPDTRKGGSLDKRTPGRGGIRDRIHQFDSACKDNVGYHPRRDERVNRHHQRERQNEDVRSPPRHPLHQDKENEPNCKRTDGARKLSPAITRRKKKSGRDRQGDAMEGASSPVHHPRQAEPSTTKHPNRRESHGLKRDVGKRDLRDNDEEDVGMNGPNETTNGNMYQNDESEHCDSMEDDDMDIAERNRAALFPHRSKQSTNSKSGGHGARSHKKRPRRESNPLAHPLIQSPLRKHMKEVNDAACSNATCTITKEPFPLLPPGARAASNPLAAVAGWEVDASGEERRDGGRVGELNAVAGNVSEGMEQFCGDGGGGDKRDGNEATETWEDSREALDLLSSAAFLFKHSRRNLG